METDEESKQNEVVAIELPAPLGWIKQRCAPVAEYVHMDEGSNVWQMVVADYCSPLQWIEFSS